MRGMLLLAGVLLGAVACSSNQQSASTSDSSSAAVTTAETNTSTSTEGVSTPPPPDPVTTTPPGGRMNALFCQFTAYNGGPYYVQVFNPLQPPGMCIAAERTFTQEEFQAVPNLMRRCILDRDEQIAQKHAIVSIYSDGTQSSVEAARIMCNSTGNEFTE